MGDMKEIRDAALAYYKNLSREQQQEVQAFFHNIDTDGDGTVTKEEFQQIFEQMDFPGSLINYLFQAIDKNGDGSLDFEESITLYYSLMTQKVIGCDGCKALFMKGLYFTCVDCFEQNQTTTFDLCTSCYGSRNYVHQHCNFLDNYALLRSKAAHNNSELAKQPVSLEESSFDEYEPENYQIPRSRSSRAEVALSAFRTGVEIGSVAAAAASCIIM